MVECGGLEMFAASLDKSSQVSFEHAKPTNQSLSRPIVSYSVRKSVRRIAFLTSGFTFVRYVCQRGLETRKRGSWVAGFDIAQRHGDRFREMAFLRPMETPLLKPDYAHPPPKSPLRRGRSFGRRRSLDRGRSLGCAFLDHTTPFHDGRHLHPCVVSGRIACGRFESTITVAASYSVGTATKHQVAAV